jgi:hypothetical protein
MLYFFGADVVVGVGGTVDVQFSSSFGTTQSWCPLHVVPHVPAGIWHWTIPIFVHIWAVVVGTGDGVVMTPCPAAQFGMAMQDQLPASQVQARQSFSIVSPFLYTFPLIASLHVHASRLTQVPSCWIISSGQWQPSTHGVSHDFGLAIGSRCLLISAQVAGQEEPQALYTLPFVHVIGQSSEDLQRTGTALALQAWA